MSINFKLNIEMKEKDVVLDWTVIEGGTASVSNAATAGRKEGGR